MAVKSIEPQGRECQTPLKQGGPNAGEREAFGKQSEAFGLTTRMVDPSLAKQRGGEI